MLKCTIPVGQKHLSTLLCLLVASSSSQFAFSRSLVLVQLAAAYGSATHICAFAMWTLRDDSSVVKLTSCDRCHIGIKNVMFSQYSVKKRLLRANMLFSCVYLLVLILVYVMLMKVRPVTASWNILIHTGLLVLAGSEKHNSVIPCLGFCSSEIAAHILSAVGFFVMRMIKYWPGCPAR